MNRRSLEVVPLSVSSRQLPRRHPSDYAVASVRLTNFREKVYRRMWSFEPTGVELFRLEAILQ
ncbi:hypothetical protein RR46_02895 [Papilio xuthus]|uniref:Uncharacterized protein n=1 Tax=Papilio xuthus TaxID=66420 RepID=A0A194Q3J0_PAPXU|nr:hypothetical protein RR46_02895 [Papilio xuthus]